MSEVSKICKFCQEEKLFSFFPKSKLGKNGVKNYCKVCNAKMIKEYRLKNPDKYKPKTPEEISRNNERTRQRCLIDPEYKEKLLANSRRKKNSEAYKEKARVQRKKWMENPKNRIAKNMRDRMRIALRGESKLKSTLEMTGIPFEDFKTYLESKFTEGMSWENYGHKGWHVDHIIPCAFFDMSNPDQQRICFYYKNLQPMWAKENIAKLNRVNVEEILPLLTEIKKDLSLL